MPQVKTLADIQILVRLRERSGDFEVITRYVIDYHHLLDRKKCIAEVMCMHRNGEMIDDNTCCDEDDNLIIYAGDDQITETECDVLRKYLPYRVFHAHRTDLV